MKKSRFYLLMNAQIFHMEARKHKILSNIGNDGKAIGFNFSNENTRLLVVHARHSFDTKSSICVSFCFFVIFIDELRPRIRLTRPKRTDWRSEIGRVVRQPGIEPRQLATKHFKGW